VSAESLRRFIGHNKSVRGEITFEELVERRIIICGGPETVRDAIRDCHHQAGFEHLLCLLQFATLPADLTERNVRLFAKEVLPFARSLGDKDYRGFDARSVAAE
jgi:alkanesulfonate monooxygenase SsuD/methylene tetrahydromethanopterin reductase-like flavin-dependent oxidoreductase (luciferase family)